MSEWELGERSDVEVRVLQAARKLFLQRGVAKTPLRAIAAEAGTSESGILRFFHDKSDLAQAIMDWCWSEVTTCMREAARAASERTADPREVLLAVVQGILEAAASERERTRFLVSHFNYDLSGWSGDSGARSSRPRFQAYCDYRAMIDELCERVVAYDPELAKDGLTRQGLCHFVLSMIYGITGGWFLSEENPAVHGAPLAIEEALAVFRKVLFPAPAGKHSGAGQQFRPKPRGAKVG